MSDPLEQAVRAFENAPMCDACDMDDTVSLPRPKCYCTHVGLQAALPHLRRMHFQEAAELLEVEWGRDNPTLVSAGFDEAASFLRGIE